MISFHLITIFSAQNSLRTQRSHPTSISSSPLPQGKGQHSTLVPPRLENPMSTEVPTETAGSGNKGQPYQIQRLLNNDPENDTTVLGFVFQRSLANEVDPGVPSENLVHYPQTSGDYYSLASDAVDYHQQRSGSRIGNIKARFNRGLGG
ncbi:hypothetical protein CEP53_004961 [Fusarium sp. AF-6]|nr:hypothetical protein CEP53_004961 [Fusarium sp. AF-6]